MQQNLYAIYIGGKHPSSLIEVHDIRFVVADRIENTYQILKNTWWGTPDSLHIDAFGVIDHIDGYDITVKNSKPSHHNHQLYFVNLGGYDNTQFIELHKNIFVIATSTAEAKAKALEQINDWQLPHRDNLYDIDQIINLNNLLENQKLYLHLEQNLNFKALAFTCAYIPIK